MGFVLPMIIIVFIHYALFGRYMPIQILMHPGVDWRQFINNMYFPAEGIFGVTLWVVSTVVFHFVLFGVVAQRMGLGQFFIDNAMVVAGKYTGGPAKVSVVSSAFFGTISGSSIANTVSTGSLTIPNMKRLGYPGHFAGGVEAASSAGGQITPPIMGAASFLMAEFLEVPYTTIVIAAIVPASALDIDERFEPGRAVADLGGGFQIMDTYFKRYSACRWIHSAVEALLQVMTEYGLGADDMDSVHVETFRQAADLNNLADPPSPESAQYSIPYCLGIAATKGDNALMPLAADDLHDPAAVAFANKVTVTYDDGLAADFPVTVPARVIVDTKSGRVEAQVDLPWGEPGGPQRRADLVAKFHALAARRVGDHRASAIVAAVENLKNGPIDPLFDLLSRPAGSDIVNLEASRHSVG